MRRLSVQALAICIAVTISSCGNGSSSSSTSSAGTSTNTAPPAAADGGGASVSTGPVRAVLRAQDHAPVVNRPWSYSVRVTDASGHPLSGRVDIEFVFAGTVVGHDTPPTHPLTKGRWHDVLRFPAEAVGHPLSFRAVVQTARGSATLTWPVTVAK
jgi:hypothetical protein